MRSKIVTADEAIALIRDGDTLASTGFVQTGFAEPNQQQNRGSAVQLLLQLKAQLKPS
ncbi:MAG: hypothetical protein J5X23_00980 [Candidatus Accumulibacter sp.]|uniref:hypothetical protein n=1 Tax=Accumulibacter sp. TaxID=2053492 RepID=UPI001B2648A7|nr:hypothetical protein [Accumulibacter sp.]MBO3713581.1 hypothetical protein [Accumulibacter sp.]